MAKSADSIRRWLGILCLAVAGGMLIGGQTVLKSTLNGVTYLFYWLGCFGFTMASVFIALLDARAVRQRTRDEQQALIEQTIGEIKRKNKQTNASND